jgi:transcription antitermination factor NusG
MVTEMRKDPKREAGKFKTPHMHSRTVAETHKYKIQNEVNGYSLFSRGGHFLTIKNGSGNWSHTNGSTGETIVGSHYGSLNTFLSNLHEQTYNYTKDTTSPVRVFVLRVPKTGSLKNKDVKDVINFKTRGHAEKWISGVSNNHPEIKKAYIIEDYENGQAVKVISGPHRGRHGVVLHTQDHEIVSSDRSKRGILKKIAHIRFSQDEEPVEIATSRLKKLQESEPVVLVKHQTWGDGRMVPGQYRIDPEKQYTLDVMFSHGIERHVPYQDLLFNEEGSKYFSDVLNIFKEEEKPQINKTEI